MAADKEAAPNPAGVPVDHELLRSALGDLVLQNLVLQGQLRAAKEAEAVARKALEAVAAEVKRG